MNNQSNQIKKKIVIVGAGVGGITLAARLARNGHEVSVYEKNDFSGGRCSLFNERGFRFDQGPSLLLMREIFEEAFSDLGENMQDHVDLLKCEPNYRIHFHDEKSLELSSDFSKLLEEVGRFEGNSVNTKQNLLKFIQETHLHYDLSVEFALKGSFSSIWDLLKLKYLPLPFRLHLFDSVYGRACKYFKSTEMRKAFTFQTMYLGMSPYDAPAPYSLLQYTEIGGGIWYPKGGFNKVFQKLEDIAKKYGAEFHYSKPVEKFIVSEEGEKRVKGILLEDGTRVEADIVVCNADLVYAYNKLLPETKYGKSLGENCQLTSSSISFYWGMKQKISELTTHNIFIAKEYKASFDQIFVEKKLPDEPSFYLNVPSRIDPSAAPNGKDTIIVLVPVGHLVQGNIEKQQDFLKLARNAVIEKLEKQLKIKNFASLIELEIVNHPKVWESKFNLWKGSILGLSHNLSQVLYFRPRTRCEEFPGLYFVGASTQPGTGVPVVLCGAKTVAKQIQDDIVNRSQNDIQFRMILFAILLGLMSLLLYFAM